MRVRVRFISRRAARTGISNGSYIGHLCCAVEFGASLCSPRTACVITSLPKMPSEARARLVTSLSQELRTVRADAVDPLGDVLPILAHATGAQRAAVYGLSAEEQGWSIDFFGILGMPSARGALLRSDIDASFRQGKRFALYDPSKVEAGQRDRVVAASSWRSICEGALPRAIDALPGRKPTITRWPESARFSAWAWPWLP